MLQHMQRAAATAALLRALTTTTFDEVSSLKICLPTGKVLQQASVCLSVCRFICLPACISNPWPAFGVLFGQTEPPISAGRRRFLWGGKKLRVAKIFYSFALKSLKLLRPDVIS